MPILTFLLLLLVIAQIGASSGHEHPSLERRLTDIVELVDLNQPLNEPEPASIERISGLVQQMLMYSGLGTDEMLSEAEMVTMVDQMIAVYPTLGPFEGALLCLLRSILFEELQYIPLPPRAAYKDNEVCLDKSCGKGAKEIKFVNKNPKTMNSSTLTAVVLLNFKESSGSTTEEHVPHSSRLPKQTSLLPSQLANYLSHPPTMAFRTTFVQLEPPIGHTRVPISCLATILSLPLT